MNESKSGPKLGVHNFAFAGRDWEKRLAFAASVENSVFSVQFPGQMRHPFTVIVCTVVSRGQKMDTSNRGSKGEGEGKREETTLPSVLKGNVYFCTLNSLPCYFSIIGNKASFSRPKFHVKRQGRVDVPNAALSLSVELICPPKIDANRLSVWLASQINNNLLPTQLQVIRTPQNAAQNQAFDVCQGPSPIWEGKDTYAKLIPVYIHSTIDRSRGRNKLCLICLSSLLSLPSNSSIATGKVF